MKVLHLSAAVEGSGAGNAVLLTHYALLKQGIDSKVLFIKTELKEENIFSFETSAPLSRMRRVTSSFLDRFPVMLYPKRTAALFSPGIVGNKIRKHHLLKWADVIHVHWSNHGFFTLKETQSWKRPVVWTIRDMWVLTGGCHYALNCENFYSACGNCPSLGSSSKHDLSYLSLKLKRKWLNENKNITWVAISTWISDQAKKSSVLNGNEIMIIPSGVDSTCFNIIERSRVRKRNMIPENVQAILIGAVDIREEYKGFSYVKRLLDQISSDILVLTFGETTFLSGEIKQEVHHFGKVADKNQLCEIYNCADLFLGPSVAEAMGKTFLEAQLCGVPTLAFKGTGPADIIKHLETGYLANYKDSQDLLHGFEYCNKKNWNREMIRNLAVEKFDIAQISTEYIKVYQNQLMLSR